MGKLGEVLGKVFAEDTSRYDVPLPDEIFSYGPKPAVLTPAEQAREDAMQLSEELERRYEHRWRQQLAAEAAEEAIGTIPDAYQSPFVRNAAHQAARLALGLKPLQQEEGEQ